LCKASASILLEYLLGKNVLIIQQLTDDNLLSMLGSSEISYSRRKCALMCLEALRSLFVEHNS
jgi:NifU-like protein involved in Fe-S cluster formation